MARLAQSVEHETLNLRVVGSSPTLGEIFFSFQFFFHPLEKCLQVHHWSQYFFSSTCLQSCQTSHSFMVFEEEKVSRVFFFVWSTEKFGGNPTERPTGAGRKRNKELLGRYDQIRYRGRGWAIGAVDTIQVSIGPPHKHTHTHTHTPAFCLFVCVFVCLISSFCSRLLGSGPNRWWSLNGTVAGRDESNWSTVSDASNQSLTGNGFSPVFFIFFLFFGRFCFHFHSIFFFTIKKIFLLGTSQFRVSWVLLGFTGFYWVLSGFT